MSKVSPLQGKLGRVVSTFGRRGRTGGVGQEADGLPDGGAGFEEGEGAEVIEGEGEDEDRGEGAEGVGEVEGV